MCFISNQHFRIAGGEASRRSSMEMRSHVRPAPKTQNGYMA